MNPRGGYTECNRPQVVILPTRTRKCETVYNNHYDLATKPGWTVGTEGIILISSTQITPSALRLTILRFKFFFFLKLFSIRYKLLIRGAGGDLRGSWAGLLLLLLILSLMAYSGSDFFFSIPGLVFGPVGNMSICPDRKRKLIPINKGVSYLTRQIINSQLLHKNHSCLISRSMVSTYGSIHYR